MMNILITYALTVLAAWVGQQGATWLSMFSWNRILKSAFWPVVLLRPLFASLQEQHEERLRGKNI